MQPKKRVSKMEDIRFIKRGSFKARKFSSSEKFKFAQVLIFTIIMASMFAKMTSQSTQIRVLEETIKQDQNKVFIETDKGDKTLKIETKKGNLVKYKGVWVNPQILHEIDNKFTDKADVMKAIMIAEAGKQDEVNHNCRYDNAGNLKTDGTGRSTFCKSEYHAKIGTDSVDCGYLQLNVKGNKCPTDIFDPKKQVEIAYEKMTVGGCGGLDCWSSYKYNRSKIIKIMNS